MLSIHPSNSIYEILYMQRKDQPPLYFLLLKFWTFVFGYNDYSARLLSIIIGSAGIYAIGTVNNYLFNKKVALFSAFIVAFNFRQIEYSLEARFYGLLFLLSIICNS